mgnify:CR=1 FL=1
MRALSFASRRTEPSLSLMARLGPGSGLEACLDQQGGAVERERVWLVEQKARTLMIADRFEGALAWIRMSYRDGGLVHELRDHDVRHARSILHLKRLPVGSGTSSASENST